MWRKELKFAIEALVKLKSLWWFQATDINLFYFVPFFVGIKVVKVTREDTDATSFLYGLQVGDRWVCECRTYRLFNTEPGTICFFCTGAKIRFQLCIFIQIWLFSMNVDKMVAICRNIVNRFLIHNRMIRHKINWSTLTKRMRGWLVTLIELRIRFKQIRFL